MTKENTSQKISLGGFAIVNKKRQRPHLDMLPLYRTLKYKVAYIGGAYQDAGLPLYRTLKYKVAYIGGAQHLDLCLFAILFVDFLI